ncbi:MAG: hypothetical protein WAN28_05930 [Terracidiphilus sp.]
MATSTINHTHGFKEPLTEATGVMRKENPDLYDPRMPRMFPVHRMIYIYSVARQNYPKQHPYFKGVLQAPKKGERFALCCAVPDPPQQLSIDAERGGKRVDVEPRDEAGWRVAIDILNPNNPSLNPYFTPSPEQAALYEVGKDVNLIKFGLFPSLNNPPNEEELLKAEQTRDAADDELINEAFQEQASNPQGFRRWLKAHPGISAAMEARGVTADWHHRAERKIKCPNCGDSVIEGVAFHKSSAGVVCILDPERAAKAGVEVKRGPGRPRNEE